MTDPLAEESPQHTAPLNGYPPPVASGILLLVDDDPTMLRLARLTFMADFKQVLSSEDPREGLRLAMTYKPAVILLDNDMPGMTGVEMLKLLKDMPATRHIPVIMLTGNNTEANVMEALSHQVAGYLLKPCDPQNLHQTVMKALPGKGASPDA